MTDTTPTKPAKPGKPTKARKPRGEKRNLTLTDGQLALCASIAAAAISASEWGIRIPPLAVAQRALEIGLQQLGDKPHT